MVLVWLVALYSGNIMALQPHGSRFLVCLLLVAVKNSMIEVSQYNDIWGYTAVLHTFWRGYIVYGWEICRIFGRVIIAGYAGYRGYVGYLGSK